MALNSVATQISTYQPEGLSENLTQAKYAVDGNFDTDMSRGARCAITTAVPGAWWQVDLSTYYQIIRVGITTRIESGNIHVRIVVK